MDLMLHMLTLVKMDQTHSPCPRAPDIDDIKFYRLARRLNQPGLLGLSLEPWSHGYGCLGS